MGTDFRPTQAELQWEDGQMVLSRRTLTGMAAALLGATGVRSAQAADPSARGHRVAMQVSTRDPAVFELALNNIANLSKEFSASGEDVEMEVVAYGPGLHMVREDTSPVKARIKSVSQSIPGIVLSACGNTMTAMEHAEGRKIELLPGIVVVKAGAVRLVTLQEAGWSYLRI